MAAGGSRGSGLLPPSPRPPPPAGKPPSAYLHWVSAPHPPGQEQPSTTAKITENRSQRGSRYAVPGRGRVAGPRRAGGGGRPRREGAPPEAEPFTSSRPGGHRGAFCSPPSSSPCSPPGRREGHGRRGAGGTAPGGGKGQAGGRRPGLQRGGPGRERGPKGRNARPSRGAFSGCGQKPESKPGPGGEK